MYLKLRIPFKKQMFPFQEEVFFPCITICNLNLVEASYFKSKNISEGEVYKMDWLINEFIRGYSQGTYKVLPGYIRLLVNPNLVRTTKDKLHNVLTKFRLVLIMMILMNVTQRLIEE